MVASGLLHALAGFPTTPLQKEPQCPLNRWQDWPQTQPGSFGGDKNENLLYLSGITPWLIQPVPLSMYSLWHVCARLLNKGALSPPPFKLTSCTPKKTYHLGFPQAMSLKCTRNALYLGSPQAMSSVQK